EETERKLFKPGMAENRRHQGTRHGICSVGIQGSEAMIKFTVWGEPVAQGRPRASTINGHVKMYDPKKSREFKQYVRLVASQHRPQELLTGPLKMKVKVFKPTLKSFSQKKKAAAEKGEIRPTTKPDVDNYIKSVFDG